MDNKTVAIVENARTNMLLESIDSTFAAKEHWRIGYIIEGMNCDHDPHVLWRRARGALYERKLSQAQEYARHAAEMDDTIGEVCKWAAILFAPSSPKEGLNRDINQFNYYVTKAIESDPNLDSTTYQEFAKIYLGLLELQYPDSTKSDLRCYAISMLEKADEAAKHISPTMIKTIRTLEPISGDTNLFTRTSTICREIINEFGSSKDPNDKKVSKLTIVIVTIFNLYSDK